MKQLVLISGHSYMIKVDLKRGILFLSLVGGVSSDLHAYSA